MYILDREGIPLNQNKRTIFEQVLIVNMVLSLLFICIFGFNYIYTNNKFKQEAQEHSGQILQTMIQNFQSETVRLTAFMEMCKKDRSFLLSFSNKLSTKSFVKYGSEASEKLSLIQYALPYAENVYAYVNNSKKYILPNKSMVDKDIFQTYIYPKYNLTENVPDFENMQEGFYVTGDSCFYISKCFDYGTFIIQFNGEKFSAINNIKSVLPDCEIVILDNMNKIFAASSKEARNIVDEIYLNKDTSKYINYEGTKYYLRQHTLQSGFQFVLLEKTSNIQAYQQKNNITNMAAGAVLFIGCALLIYLNNAIYRPLKIIAKKFVTIGEKGNEIEIISGKMKEIINENLEMQLQLQSNKKIQSDIELNYAIHAKQEISEALADELYNQYGQYRMMTVAIQNQTGGGEELFESVNDYFMDTLECKSIFINSYVQSYIVPTSYSLEEITHILGKYFNTFKPNVYVFIGISNPEEDFKKIHNIYKQSYERMLKNTIPVEKRVAMKTEEDLQAKGKAAVISVEVINTISKYTLGGTEKDIKEIFEHIFFSDSALTLKDSMLYFEQLAGLISSLINQSNNVIDSSEFHSIQKNVIYNPIYMYYILYEDYQKLNAGVSKTSASLKYGIMEYINHHYKEPLSLESISSEFGITPVYLSSWFKKNTGINLSVYIMNVRMEEAKKILLNNQHLKIADIAVSIGFLGTSTFIRQFKSYTGCTPEQYRQLNN